jgi:hypothetical protein
MTSFLSLTKVEESIEDLKVNDLEKYVRLKLGQKVFPTPELKQCLVKVNEKKEEKNPYCQCKNCTYNKWYYTWKHDGHLRLDFDARQFTKSNLKIIELFKDSFQEVKVVIHTYKNSVQAYFVHLEDYQKFNYWEQCCEDMKTKLPYIASMDLTNLTTVEIMKTLIERVEKIKQNCLYPCICGYQSQPLCDNCVIRENQMVPSIFNFNIKKRAFFSCHFPKTTQKLLLNCKENDLMIIDCENNFNEQERKVIHDYEINQIEELIVHKRIHSIDKIRVLKDHKYARGNYEMNGFEVVNELTNVQFGKYIFNILILYDGRIKYCDSLGEKTYTE